MSSRQREADWWRERRFPVWDRTGGPGKFGTWLYGHPALGYLALLLLAGGVIALGLVLGSEPAWATWGVLLALLAIPAWFWRLQVKVFREWVEQHDSAAGPREPVDGGWWERTVADQQARAEVENQHADGELLSPALNRLFGLSFILVGVGLAAFIALTFVGFFL